jgi:hypothetical protein
MHPITASTRAATTTFPIHVAFAPVEWATQILVGVLVQSLAVQYVTVLRGAIEFGPYWTRIRPLAMTSCKMSRTRTSTVTASSRADIERTVLAQMLILAISHAKL